MNEQAIQTYHHGNVKTELVDAAMRLMCSEEIEQISLRRLAKEIGVTPSAVYNHFPDKRSLMVAIKIRAFEALNDYFDNIPDDASDPETTIRNLFHGYFRFSQMHPTQFLILFRGDTSLTPPSYQSLRMSCRTINRFRSVMMQVYEKYQVKCTEQQLVNSVLLSWSQLHGLVILRNSGSIIAAVGCHDWPIECSLRSDSEVFEIIDDIIDRLIVNVRLPSGVNH